MPVTKRRKKDQKNADKISYPIVFIRIIQLVRAGRLELPRCYHRGILNPLAGDRLYINQRIRGKSERLFATIAATLQYAAQHRHARDYLVPYAADYRSTMHFLVRSASLGQRSTITCLRTKPVYFWATTNIDFANAGIRPTRENSGFRNPVSRSSSESVAIDQNLI